MKIVSSLLLLNLLLLCGCHSSLVTRRDLYSPKKGSGYWTDRHKHGKAVAEAGLTRTKPPAPEAGHPATPEG